MPNQLVLHIQPEEGISLRFAAKKPGPSMRLGAVDMDFEYKDYFGSQPSTGYERLLHDCMIGDADVVPARRHGRSGMVRGQPSPGRVEGAAPARFPQLCRWDLGTESIGRTSGAGRARVEKHREMKPRIFDTPRGFVPGRGGRVFQAGDRCDQKITAILCRTIRRLDAQKPVRLAGQRKISRLSLGQNIFILGR